MGAVYNMSYQIVKLLFLAGLAFAAPDLNRFKRGYGNSGSGATAGSYASSSSSSSASGAGGAGGIACAFIGQPAVGGYSGVNDGGQVYSGNRNPAGSYNGAGGQSGASAISSSSAGSFGGGGSGYGKPAGYGNGGANSIPSGVYGNGNTGGATYASNYPGGGYGGFGGAPSGFGYGGAPGYGAPGFPPGFPAGCGSGFQGNFGPDPYQIHNQIMNQIKRIHDETLRQSGGYGGPAYQGGGNVGAYASGYIGPGGGEGVAGVYPSDGIAQRFGDTAPQGVPVQSISGKFPPPMGNGGTVFGVATRSESGSQTINGKTTSYKKSSVSVNDDGKVTTYNASDP